MKIENLLNIYVSKKFVNVILKYFYLDNSIKEDHYMELQKINYHPFYKYFKYFYSNLDEEQKNFISNNINIIRLLMDKGADNFDFGLYYACRNGNIQVVRLMIQKGAKNLNDGMNIALKRGHINIVKFMIENKKIKK